MPRGRQFSEDRREPGAKKPGGLAEAASRPSTAAAALPDHPAPRQQKVPPAGFVARPAPSAAMSGRTEEKIRSADALKAILEPDFELQLTRDLPFAIREHQRKFQFGIALGWRWIRR